jgi:hypothetical protein
MTHWRWESANFCHISRSDAVPDGLRKVGGHPRIGPGFPGEQRAGGEKPPAACENGTFRATTIAGPDRAFFSS